ncbi:MAG: nucleotide exchange factor GrpE [Defluviitaleaceae bacterium]|nr:nucleotide exchange factor GrpE [Defluviitaleaceae bacterium]MCL2276042.1 nucleotide exchange factor GrpE [Defluviitaleaceae bacterium]
MSLFETWQVLSMAADKKMQAYVTALFDGAKNAACEMLAQDAARFSRLGENDERMFEQTVRLMGAYKEAAGIIEATVAPHPAVKDLLVGIGDVLSSRLKEYEDTLATEASPNPVADEKRGIIERAKVYTGRQIENMASKYPDEDAPEQWANLRGAFLMGTNDWETEIKNEINGEKIQQEIYTHYQDGLRFCLLGLDDLHGRTAARAYTELIEREWEMLEAVIRVQVQAFEMALEAHPCQSAVEVLDILREAYQQTGPLVEMLQRLPKDGRASQSVCRSFDEFSQALEKVELPEIDENEADKPLDAAPFLAALGEETANLFGQQRIEFLKAAYRLQRLVGDEILMAEEAAKLFVTAHTLLSPSPADATEIEAQIIKGVAETLEIKVESLKDSIIDFNGDSASLLQSFAKEKTDVTDEIKDAAFIAVRNAWFESPPADEAGVAIFFEQCRESESFAPYRVDYEKHVTQYSSKMEKAVARFKCDILLYEVGTYEEILNHSVSRLREAESPQVQMLAVNLHEVFNALEVLLKKNNIIPIRPAPHDVFNGKEHEVLVAEKQEGFNKGEIIKLVGSGYRNNDVVLVRANVIAAR